MKLPRWLGGRSETTTAVTEITDKKGAVGVTNVPVGPQGSGWWGGRILESFTGAWQKNVIVDNIHDVTTFSGVYACISLITHDIQKLRPMLMKDQGDGTTKEVDYAAAHERVLVKPNKYQTRIQFFGSWITSKLLYGNTFVLKLRDGRGVINEMHVLDPRLVKPLITEEGDVWYQLGRDLLAKTQMGSFAVPATEIIHDRGVCLWHPLVGVSPIYACGISATQGNRIIANSAKFFENMSRPSGMLTAPDVIDEVTAQRLKETFNAAFSGGNLGRMFVAGDGIEYKPLSIPASDAQLIEQLRWTIEDAARCFHVPLYKLSVGEPPRGYTVEQLNVSYYAETLQILIESIEILLDEGLAVPTGMSVEFDLEALLRMDESGLATVLKSDVGAGIMSPNEARRRRNLPPVKGGESPLMQQQNFSLADLAARSAAGIKPTPIAGSPPPPPVTQDEFAPGESAPPPPADPAAKMAENLTAFEALMAGERARMEQREAAARDLVTKLTDENRLHREQVEESLRLEAEAERDRLKLEAEADAERIRREAEAAGEAELAETLRKMTDEVVDRFAAASHAG